jgi:hypothetical protein
MDSKPNAHEAAGSDQTGGASAHGEATTNQNTGSVWAGFEQAHPRPAESPATGEKATDGGGKAPRRSGASVQKNAWAEFEQTTAAALAAGEKASKAATATASAAVDATRERVGRAAQQGQEATRLGARAAAEVQNSLAEMSADQNRRAAETAVRVTDVYQGVLRQTTGDLQAVIGSYANMGRGIQRWQFAFFNQMTRSMQRVARKHEDLLRSASLTQAAQFQHALYIDTVHEFATDSTALLELACQTALEAVQPFLERSRDTNG